MRDRIVKGGTALLMRQMVSLPINAVGVALASRFLLPADFGIQAILTLIIALALMLTDLGTSQALVQSKTPPTLTVLRQVQYLKSGCGVFVLTILALLSSWLIRILSLSPSFLWIFPACGLIGWLQSQRAFHATALQRSIEWQRLAKVEMVEVATYNCVLIITAYYVRSAWCFIIALGFRWGIGIIILRAVSKPWAEHCVAAKKALFSLLRFGVPLQSSTILSVIMNSANPIVVGNTLGISAVGIINWSNNIVSLPQLPFQPLPYFLFSVLSERRRQDKDDNKVIEDMTYLAAFLMAVFSLIIIFSLDLLVRYLFGPQWTEAIPAVSILILTNIVIVPSIIITAQLNANGHSGSSLIILSLGVLLWWTMILVAALLRGGLIGYAVAVLGSTLVAFAVQCLIASKRLGIRVKWIVSFRLIAYVVFCVSVLKIVLRKFFEVSAIWGDVIRLSIALAVFASLAYFFEGRRLKQVYIGARSLVS